MTIHKLYEYAIAVIAFLVLILGCLSFFLIENYQHVHTTRGVHIFELIQQGKIPLTADDAKSISSWMTFDFINRVFKLPAAYLQSSLNITDAKYPNMPLWGYARAHGLDEATFVSEVQADVGAYLNTQTKTP